MALTFEAALIADPAEWPRRIAAWQALLGEDGVGCGVYCDPGFVEQTIPLRDGCSVLLVTGADERSTCCVLPFRFQRERLPVQLGPYEAHLFPVRVLRLMDFEFTARAGFDRLSILHEVMPFLRAARNGDLVFVDNVPTQGMADLGETTPRWSLHRPQVTYVIRNQTDYEGYWSSLGSKVRVETRRRAKKLSEKCPDAMVLKKYTRTEEMAEIHEYMMTVWRKSWHGNVGAAAPLDLPALERLAARGWVRSYVLLTGGDPIAYQWGYQYRGKYFYDSTAFDGSWKDHGPGKVLSYLVIRDLFDNEMPRELDFGFGYNKYKEDFGTHQEERARVWVPLTGKGRVALAALSATEQLGNVGRDVARRVGVHAWLRARSRQRRPSGDQ